MPNEYDLPVTTEKIVCIFFGSSVLRGARKLFCTLIFPGAPFPLQRA